MNIAKSERRAFYMYLDEFQTFVGVSEDAYSKLLSRGRKYNFGLVLAHQQTGQLSRNVLAEIFGNVSTFITFSVAYADAQRLSQQYIMNIGGQKKPLPPEEFVNQRIGESLGKINQTVFKLATPLVPTQPNPKLTDYIIHRSAQNYGLHGYTRKTWEANVKRNEPKQLPAGDDNEPLDPSEVF